MGTFLRYKVEIQFATYPDLNFQLCTKLALGSCPGVGLVLKLFYRENKTWLFM